VIADTLTPGPLEKPLATSILEFAPVIGFEAVAGLWLLIRGARPRPGHAGAE